MALNTKVSATTMVRGLIITISPDIISRVKNLPLRIQWRREDKRENSISKDNFFTAHEKPIEDKDGVRRESLPYP